MPISTIPQTIARGDVSIYLSANDNAKGALFGGRIAAPGSPISIALITDALRWGYDGGAQTEQDLRQMANYLTWLIGMYGQQAEYILSGAGGGTVIPPSGSTPNQLNFTVAASGTTLIDGQSSVTLTQFIGFDLLVNKNGQALNQVTSGVVYYTWSKTSGLLTVVPSAFLGDEFQIQPV